MHGAAGATAGEPSLTGLLSPTLCCNCVAARLAEAVAVVADATVHFTFGSELVATGGTGAVFRGLSRQRASPASSRTSSPTPPSPAAGSCDRRSPSPCIRAPADADSDSHHSSNELAVKIVPKADAAGHPLPGHRIADIGREVATLSLLEHAHIVRLFGVVQDQTCFAIATEYCPHGDLCSIVTQRCGLSEGEASTVSSQLVSALCYMHSLRVSHGDVKTENVVVSHLQRGHVAAVRLVDCGMSTYYGAPLQQCSASPGCCRCATCRVGPTVAPGARLVRIRGTIRYTAPEVLEHFSELGLHYRRVNPHDVEAQDVWSMGVCAYHLLTGDRPFLPAGWHAPRCVRDEAADVLALVSENHSELWSGRSPSDAARDFVSSLLRTSPDERPSFETARQHEFITTAHARRSPPRSPAARFRRCGPGLPSKRRRLHSPERAQPAHLDQCTA
eukprot:TRINITY_DN9393_c0_g1_i1.p1 TRINITY_DN9393_c0_g1~~TRINITY_DN9393_c0_g1_i1.p1  ORF type:complete len:460 (+),score=83.47 TRINITY_DN9393_c0_g1_i1:44-1381(+)